MLISASAPARREAEARLSAPVGRQGRSHEPHGHAAQPAVRPAPATGDLLLELIELRRPPPGPETAVMTDFERNAARIGVPRQPGTTYQLLATNEMLAGAFAKISPVSITVKAVVVACAGGHNMLREGHQRATKFRLGIVRPSRREPCRASSRPRMRDRRIPRWWRTQRAGSRRAGYRRPCCDALT